MFTLSDFNEAINAKHTPLLESECKLIYDTVILSNNWESVYESITGKKIENRLLKKKIQNFAAQVYQNPEERVKFMKSHLGNVKVKDMDYEQSKKELCTGKGLASFVRSLEENCSQSLPRLRSNDIVTMYLALAAGGPNLLKEKSENLRFKDRNKLIEVYSSEKIKHDVESIQTIISSSC